MSSNRGLVIEKHIERNVDILRTSRVMQVEGIYDMSADNQSREAWDVSITLPDSWNIGLIVGPSGSGKTTIAREIFGDRVIDENRFAWSDDNSIIDDFPQSVGVKDIVALLSSVGFSSPPNWLRPYRVLSNGEKFRVFIARVLAESQHNEVSVVDEFTSVVDRTVAQIGCAAIQKTIRKLNKQFVGITCHYDIVDWIEPDWIYYPATNEYFVGRYLYRRPKIDIEVCRVTTQDWKLFKKHHYLSANIHRASACFCAIYRHRPIAFCAVRHHPHPISPCWMIHRLVTLPEFQGVGVGMILASEVASIFAATRKDVRIVTSHPAIIKPFERSGNWKCYRNGIVSGYIGSSSTVRPMTKTVSYNRITYGLIYTGKAAPAIDAVRAGVLKL